jgi:hypothetical protein
VAEAALEKERAAAAAATGRVAELEGQQAKLRVGFVSARRRRVVVGFGPLAGIGLCAHRRRQRSLTPRLPTCHSRQGELDAATSQLADSERERQQLLERSASLGRDLAAAQEALAEAHSARVAAAAADGDAAAATIAELRAAVAAAQAGEQQARAEAESLAAAAAADAAMAVAGAAAERVRLQEAAEAARVEAEAAAARVKELEGQVSAATTQSTRATRQTKMQVRASGAAVWSRDTWGIGRGHGGLRASNGFLHANSRRAAAVPAPPIATPQALQLKELEAAKARLEEELAALRGGGAAGAPAAAAAAAQEEQEQGPAEPAGGAAAGAAAGEDVGSDAHAADQAGGGRRG